MQSFSPLQQAYVDAVLTSGRRPASVRAFMATQDQPERAFYAEYPSFGRLEQALMQGLFQEAVDTLRAAPEYATYGTREKLLALFYTWLEVMLAQRSLVVFVHRHQSLSLRSDGCLRRVAGDFRGWVRELLREGSSSGEVADRWFLPRWYDDVFWTQARLIFRFWLTDRSANFERTDVVVEKSVNFIMDLIQPNALDSGVDLLRFFGQRNH